MRSLQMEPSVWNVLAQHAESSYPRECCGALVGMANEGVGHVFLAVPLENVAPGHQTDRYAVAPLDLVTVDEKARDQGMDLLGFYHSHPNAEAFFSETDLREACPWYFYVVAGVHDGRCSSARAYAVNEEASVASEIELKRDWT